MAGLRLPFFSDLQASLPGPRSWFGVSLHRHRAKKGRSRSAALAPVNASKLCQTSKTGLKIMRSHPVINGTWARSFTWETPAHIRLGFPAQSLLAARRRPTPQKQSMLWAPTSFHIHSLRPHLFQDGFQTKPSASSASNPAKSKVPCATEPPNWSPS